jgi:AbrB family looped-hinge helix DNA binding protein
MLYNDMKHDFMTSGEHMPSALKVSRVQKKGQVTIPVEIRQKLGLAEGDLVAFIETEVGIVISPHIIVPVKPRQPMQSGSDIARSA